MRNDLRLWRTKRDAQRALMEAAEEALLTQAIEDLPATDDPFRAIQREIRRGYRARMPTFLPLPAQASEPKHAYWHGTLLSRRITAAVSLEQVCREIGLSKIETAVLVARFDGRWHSWPEAERLFNLKPGSLEPLRKRLSYYGDWLVDKLGLRQLLSNRYRMNKN